jgi:hypothetical protein
MLPQAAQFLATFDGEFNGANILDDLTEFFLPVGVVVF